MSAVGSPRSFSHYCLAVCLLLMAASPAFSDDDALVSISVQDIELRDVMEMLAVERRINVFVADGVEGRVSINIFDMKVVEAIYAISETAGFAVEERNGGYFIVERDEVGKYSESGITELRSFKVQYSNPAKVETILKEHLSNYGKITTLDDRNLIVVEDKPEFLNRVDRLLEEIDREPKQILIEAKIMEVTLTDNESLGIDWSRSFTSGDGSGTVGIRGLNNPLSAGFFFNFADPKIELALDALKERGRLRTLSTPKLLAMEDREAETQVGTQLGYRVTTTINQVTSESIEFLETGVILRVTPAVDRQGLIRLDIAPEVSDGTVSDDGIPNKTTTQLSTRMLVPDGKTIFLGGLIRRGITQSRESVPVLGDLPGVGLLFSNRSENVSAKEIVVLITPRIVDFHDDIWSQPEVVAAQEVESRIEERTEVSSEELERFVPDKKDASKGTWADQSNRAWSYFDQ